MKVEDLVEITHDNDGSNKYGKKVTRTQTKSMVMYSEPTIVKTETKTYHTNVINSEKVSGRKEKVVEVDISPAAEKAYAYTEKLSFDDSVKNSPPIAVNKSSPSNASTATFGQDKREVDNFPPTTGI